MKSICSEAKGFKKAMDAITKDYHKKVAYLEKRKEKEYANLIEKVKRESKFKAGTTIKVEETKQLMNSPIKPNPTSIYLAQVLKITPMFGGFIQLKAEILDPKCGSLTGEIRDIVSYGGAYYDVEEPDGPYQYTYEIKYVKSKNK